MEKTRPRNGFSALALLDNDEEDAPVTKKKKFDDEANIEVESQESSLGYFNETSSTSPNTSSNNTAESDLDNEIEKSNLKNFFDDIDSNLNKTLVNGLPTPIELRAALTSPDEYRNLLQKMLRPFQGGPNVPDFSISTTAQQQSPLASLMLQKFDDLCHCDVKANLPEHFRKAIQHGTIFRQIQMQKLLVAHSSNILLDHARKAKEISKFINSRFINKAVDRQDLNENMTEQIEYSHHKDMWMKRKPSVDNMLKVNSNSPDLNLSTNDKELPVRQPYTEAELAAAVRAICFGRLGTRRAASVYGIPRSTLRNKICKLNELKRREEERLGGKPISMAEFLQTMVAAESGLQSTVIGTLPCNISTAKGHSKCVQYNHSNKSTGLSQVASRIASVFQVNCRRTNLVRAPATGSREVDGLKISCSNIQIRGKMRYQNGLNRMTPMMTGRPEFHSSLATRDISTIENRKNKFPLEFSASSNQRMNESNLMDSKTHQETTKLDEMMRRIPPSILKHLNLCESKMSSNQSPLAVLSLIQNINQFIMKNNSATAPNS